MKFDCAKIQFFEFYSSRLISFPYYNAAKECQKI